MATSKRNNRGLQISINVRIREALNKSLNHERTRIDTNESKALRCLFVCICVHSWLNQRFLRSLTANSAANITRLSITPEAKNPGSLTVRWTRSIAGVSL